MFRKSWRTEEQGILTKHESHGSLENDSHFFIMKKEDLSPCTHFFHFFDAIRIVCITACKIRDNILS